MSSNLSEQMGEFYSAYAAGQLDPAFALMLETQASLRADVAANVRVSEAIAGAMFEATEPTDLSDSALDRTLQLIDEAPRADDLRAKAAARTGEMLDEIADLPDPLLDQVADAMLKDEWKPASAGISCLTLDLPTDAEVELYRIEPNARVPRHTHGGREFTLVVAGGFTDETGSFGPGDLSVKGPTDTHQPVADDGHVCYALAVRDGELKLTGMMGVIQRLLGK